MYKYFEYYDTINNLIRMLFNRFTVRFKGISIVVLS